MNVPLQKFSMPEALCSRKLVEAKFNQAKKLTFSAFLAKYFNYEYCVELSLKVMRMNKMSTDVISVGLRFQGD
jgi:hypothetical protein